jgi:hypothetical protein
MVLFDSRPGKNRMIIVGIVILQDVFERANIWLADWTIKFVPSVLFFLKLLNFKFGSGKIKRIYIAFLKQDTINVVKTYYGHVFLFLKQNAKRFCLTSREQKLTHSLQRILMPPLLGAILPLPERVPKSRQNGLKLSYENN